MASGASRTASARVNTLADLPEYDEALERDAYPRWVAAHPGLRLRYIVDIEHPMPATLTRLRQSLARTFQALATSFPRAADTDLALILPVAENDKLIFTIACTHEKFWIPEFYGGIDQSRNKKLWQQKRETLKPLLSIIEQDWLAHRRALWMSLLSAEQIAQQFLGLHLLDSRRRLENAIADYVGNPDLLSKTFKGTDEMIQAFDAALRDSHKKPRLTGLTQALGLLAEKRKHLDLAILKHQNGVLGGAAVIAALVPVAVAAGVSPDAPKAIETLKELAGEANKRLQMALLDYLAEVRRLAADHPILLVLHHLSAEDSAGIALQRRLLAAVNHVAKASDDLADELNGDQVIPPLHVKPWGGEKPIVYAPSLMDMVAAIKKTKKINVWKLPFFIDDALTNLPQDERPGVRALRALALQEADEALLARDLVLVPLELATMFLPPARIASAAVSLGLGLLRLSGTIRTYEEAQTLYHASLDPNFLATGDGPHAPGSADGIIFDMVSMVFDAGTLSRLAR